MSKWEILKKISVSVLTLLGLSALLLLVFREHLGELSAAWKALSLPHMLWLLAMGACYQLLDALALLLLVRTEAPDFSYGRALEVIYLGVFGRTSTLGAGTLPLQAYYLHRWGVEAGRGVGIMTVSFLLHKVAILLYASLLLLLEGKWALAALPQLSPYLFGGYLISLGIIGGLLLLCAWRRAHVLALGLVEKLPDTGKWPERKGKLRRQLDNLYRETATFLKDKRVVLSVVAAHGVKLGILCALPYVCLTLLGGEGISLLQGELLTALLLLMAGAVPNVAGIGPTEAVYFLLYQPISGSGLTAASLLLYRISTYYVPFLVSIFVFFMVQIRFLSSHQAKGEP